MNNNVKQEKEQGASFSIPKYILNVILPKCTIIHGEAVSSTYFQIALTVNNSEKAKSWQKGKSWIGLRTISKITGFNPRTVSIAVNVLKQLKLIEQTYHGRLKMFEIKNGHIVNVEEMIKFNNFVEYHLLFNLPTKKLESVKEKFNELNKKLHVFSPFHSKFLLKRTWIPDINNLRSSLIEAESIYKGSSLFLINLMNQQLLFKKEEKVSDNITISEKDRSLMIGCSQSTLNRYIVAYETANVITREKQNGLYQIKLNEPDNKNIESVVEDKMNNEIICPICDREMKNVRSFNLHLAKTNEPKHYMLNEFRREKRTPDYEVTMMLFNQHKDTLDSLEGISKDELKEKRNSNEEINISVPKKIVKEAKVKTEEIKFTEFKDLPSIPKPISEDTSPGLLKFFYDLNGQRSPNFGKESKQIKNLLVHKENPVSPDEIRVILKYMSRKGHMDIRFLNTSVNEALLEHQLLQDVDKDGTAAFLVKRFYDGFKMDINLQTFVREVQKIQETINSGLSFIETQVVIDFMIETDCNVLNFIGSKRNDALIKYRSQNKGVNLDSKGVNNFNNNPSFFDQDFLNILKDELAGGRTRLNKIEDKYREEAEIIAKELFMKRKFSHKFIGFEWVWRVGLKIDKRMYDLACRELKLEKQTYLEYSLQSGKLKPEQEQKIQQLKLKYEAWLQKQHEAFHTDMTFNQS